jgi:GntR family transcriptional regulator
MKPRTAALAIKPAGAAGAKIKKNQPLYRQLVQALRDDIVAGVYPVGTQLPTEEELTVRFKVSRQTVRQALRELREDGLVESRARVGTTVLPVGARDSYVHEVGSISDLIALANEIRYQVDSSELIVSDAEMTKRLGGAIGQRWLHVQGFRYAEQVSKPVCWTEVFIDGDYAGISRLIGHRPGPIFELIEDLYGERFAEVEQGIKGCAAPAKIASTLGLDEGATMIEVRRSYRLTSGKIAEVAFNLYPAEQFHFKITLRRVKS